jgi:hypothetical protein
MVSLMRGHLPVIKGVGLATLPIMVEEEASSANVAGPGKGDRQAEAHGHRRIHRVAPVFEHLQSGRGRHGTVAARDRPMNLARSENRLGDQGDGPGKKVHQGDEGSCSRHFTQDDEIIPDWKVRTIYALLAPEFGVF